MLTTRQISACVLLISGCASPRGAERARDTLVVGAAPSTTNVPPLTAAATPDSTVYIIHAFSALTASSVTASVPEMALVAADGRQTGYDPSTRRYLAQIPGSGYDSSATVEDDDDAAKSGEPPGVQDIDSRELEVPAHAGETYTLVVTAAVTGTYVLHVSLYPSEGNRDSRNIDDLALTAGEPRRFAIRVGRGTMDVTP